MPKTCSNILCYLILCCFMVSVSFSESIPVYILSKDYDKHQPPSAGSTTEVKCRISVRELSSIIETEQAISMYTYIEIEWHDPRVIVTDESLHASGLMHSFNRDEHDQFWKPDIFIANLIKLEVKRFYEDLVLMRLFVKNGKTMLNYLQMIQIKFKCVMDFTNYPFDINVCPIIFKSFSYEKHIMTLAWDDNMDGKPPRRFRNWDNVPLYRIKLQLSSTYCNRTDESKLRSCIALIVVVTRIMEFYLFQTYVPSGCFVLISWISFVVPPDAVPGRMVLLVTILLTLITMYNSVRMSSPPTSSLKAIEIWITSCIAFVFCALMEYAAVLTLRIGKVKNEVTKTTAQFLTEFRHRNNSKINGVFIKPNQTGPSVRDPIMYNDEKDPDTSSNHRHKMDRVSSVLFPISFFVFCLIYWIYFMTERARIDREFNENLHM